MGLDTSHGCWHIETAPTGITSMNTENEKIPTDPAEAEAAVWRMRELLEEVIDGSVDASTYPDGPCLDRDLRKRIKAETSAVSVGSTASLGASDAKLWANLMLKAEMFDYLCWLEDYCVFRAASLDQQAGDYLVTASDGTTCWGKTYAEAVRVAMEHDRELQDATSSPNSANEPRR